MREDAFQLGAEEHFAIVVRVVERLDAHAVASQNEPPFGLHPEGDGKHSAETGKAFAAPFHERVQNHFSVATSLEAGSASLQLQPQLMVIEYFAVEDDNHVAIRTDQRLVA